MFMAVNFDHPLPSSASIIKNRLHTKIGGAMFTFLKKGQNTESVYGKDLQ
jgi:hypothetical protein